MAVVANVNADAGERGIKTRITEIAGPEVKFLLKSGSHVGNVSFAILA